MLKRKDTIQEKYGAFLEVVVSYIMQEECLWEIKNGNLIKRTWTLLTFVNICIAVMYMLKLDMKFMSLGAYYDKVHDVTVL